MKSDKDKLAAHWRVDRYGDFQLTEAIRPGPRVPVVPREGFRIGRFDEPNSSLSVPVLAAAVSREKLFDIFLDLLGLLGSTVDFVLETSHQNLGGGHRDLYREHIDLPVLMSHFCEFDDLLLNDGCVGVAVISTAEPMEVQFDEHKLLVVYAHNLSDAQAVFGKHAISRDDRLKLITEGEHLHSTDERHVAAFEQLCCRVGIGEPADRVKW